MKNREKLVRCRSLVWVSNVHGQNTFQAMTYTPAQARHLHRHPWLEWNSSGMTQAPLDQVPTAEQEVAAGDE